jgi:hypothetical protein
VVHGLRHGVVVVRTQRADLLVDYAALRHHDAVRTHD